MTNKRYPDEFKIEAVRQITDRGHSVADVSKRLDVSTYRLYAWVKRFSPDDIRQAGLIKQFWLESGGVDVFHKSAASQ